jgi:hypothetical protein
MTSGERDFVANDRDERERDWLRETKEFLDPYGDAAEATERDAVLRGADARLAAEIAQYQLEDDERHYAEVIGRSAGPRPSDEPHPGRARRRGGGWFDQESLSVALTLLQQAGDGSSDERAGFVAKDLRVVRYALGKAHDATAVDDRLGALHHLRLLAESTLRMMWIASDTGVDSDGRPFVDSSAARRRIDAVRKRDILQLAAAYDAFHEMRGAGKPATNDLRVDAETINGSPAPRTLRDLATSPYANQPYAVHRLCSALVHAGLGMSRVSRLPIATLGELANDTAQVCAVRGWAVLRALGVDVTLDWKALKGQPPAEEA